jgi:hypothetical protein
MVDVGRVGSRNLLEEASPACGSAADFRREGRLPDPRLFDLQGESFGQTVPVRLDAPGRKRDQGGTEFDPTLLLIRAQQAPLRRKSWGAIFDPGTLCAFTAKRLRKIIPLSTPEPAIHSPIATFTQNRERDSSNVFNPCRSGPL